MALKHGEVDETLGFDSGGGTEMDPIFSWLTAAPPFLPLQPLLIKIRAWL